MPFVKSKKHTDRFLFMFSIHINKTVFNCREFFHRKIPGFCSHFSFHSGIFSLFLFSAYHSLHQKTGKPVTQAFLLMIPYFIVNLNPVYSFTAPTLTPFTKYFCKNGYAIMNGKIATIIDAFFNVSVFAPVPASGRSELKNNALNFIWKL